MLAQSPQGEDPPPKESEISGGISETPGAEWDTSPPDQSREQEINRDHGSDSSDSTSDSSNNIRSLKENVIFFKKDVYMKSLEYPKKAVSDRGDNLRKVYIEIISNNDRSVELDLREYVDRNLSLILPSLHGYVLTTPDEFSLYRSGILEDLESTANAKINESKNRVYFSSGIFRNYSIAKNNVYNINNLAKIKPYSRNYDLVLVWNKSLNGTSLSGQQNLSRFIESDLMINNNGTDSAQIFFFNNIDIEYKNKTNVFISRSRNELYNNSIMLRYGDVIAYLRSNEKYNSTDNSSSTYIYNVKDIIAFDNVIIPPGSLFVYWYYVIPRSYGTFKTNTVLFANTSGLKELSQKEFEIENQPRFNVTPKISELSVDINSILALEYNVEYLGGGPQSSSGNVSLVFDNNSNYNFVNKNGDTVNPNCEMDFKKDTSETINRFIKFRETGILSIPGIWINKKHYISSKEIVVDDWRRFFGKYGSVFIGSMALIVFFLGLIIKDLLLCDENRRISWSVKIINSELYWFFKKWLLKLYRFVLRLYNFNQNKK